MEEKELRRYAGIMAEFGLTGIEVSRGGDVIRLEKINNPGYSNIKNEIKPETAVDIKEEINDEISENNNFGKIKKIASTENDLNITEITSPIVGAFYASPGEDMEPFVKKGDRIKKGDVLCVIESMKLMNEILSEFDGIIQEVCVFDGQIVDYGCPLFKIMVE